MADIIETPDAGTVTQERRVRRGSLRRAPATRPPSAPDSRDRSGVEGRDGIGGSGGSGRRGARRVIRGGRAASAPALPEAPRPASRWVPTADQLELLASLLEAGLPLLDALATMQDMATEDRARSAFAHLQSCVHSGQTLTAGMVATGAPLHVMMLLDGGERIGRLADALRSAGVLTARIDTLRAEVRRALVYPGIVLAIGLVILTVIAVAVVPPLERTFADLGGELPRATRIVLAASRPLSSLLSLTLIAGLLAVVALLRRVVASSRVTGLAGASMVARSRRRMLHPHMETLRDHLPLSGRLRRDLRITTFAHVLASLARGGVSVDVALVHVADSLAPGRMRQVLQEAADAAVQGRSPFEEALLGRILDPSECAMLRVGERNGLVAEQWRRVADRRDRALEGHMRRVGVIIEPILVALIGAVVGGAVLALYLPTFRVMDLL